MKTQVNKIKRNLKHTLGRRQQGNTLVPVVIGLAIAAIATIGFLNQGEDLMADNKTSLATNEINQMIVQWNTAKMGTVVNDIAGADVPLLNNNVNVYGVVTVYRQGAAAAGDNPAVTPQFTYTTDDNNVCTAIDNRFADENNGIAGIGDMTCANGVLTVPLR
jgi:hypothetical protein